MTLDVDPPCKFTELTFAIASRQLWGGLPKGLGAAGAAGALGSMVSCFRVEGLGFGVWGLGFGVWG